MKKNKLATLYLQACVLLSVMMIMTGCAGNKQMTKSYTPDHILHYSKLKGMAEDLNLNDYVLYINKGESFPLQISTATDFMEFRQDHIDVVVKQKLYFRVKFPDNLTADQLAELQKLNARGVSEMSEEQRAALLRNIMVYISKDAVHWAPLYGGDKAYREILGFKHGQLSFGLMASKTEGLQASLNIRTVK